MKVFVLDKYGKALMPTSPSKARKLLEARVASKTWSKFNTFGIKLNVDIQSKYNHQQLTSLGYDLGTKFEGLSVVCGTENVLNIKLNLPDKYLIKKRMELRKNARRSRRYRNTRFRASRHDNRNRKNFIAPSQLLIVCSRLKILKEIIRIYPVSLVGMEDSAFNSKKNKRFAGNFSTMEVGKSKIRAFIRETAKLFEFKGYETKTLREKYGYKKISDKSSDSFESHNCDSLALALEVGLGIKVAPIKPLIVDDKYRFYRRQLHKFIPISGNIRKSFSKGSVNGTKKGTLVGINLKN